MPAYCRQCGTKLSPGAKFCKQCGLQLDPEIKPPVLVATPQPEVGKAPRAARSARSSNLPSKRGTFKGLPIAIGGVGVLLCLGLVVGGVLLFRQILLGRQVEPGEVTQYEESVPMGDPALEPVIEEDNLAGYTPRQVAPAETTPESVTGTTSTEPTTLPLSDGTQVLLPGSARSIQVTLSKESNTIQLSDRPDLQISGSMRVLEFDPTQIDENFLPALTIPAQELGALDPATVNAVRVGDIRLNDEIIPDHVSVLPVIQDDNGNLVIFDGLSASLAHPEAANQKTGAGKLAAHTLQNQGAQIKYVLMTFQGHLEWDQEPVLVRMIPDESLAGYRRPADKKDDKELLEKPVTNIVILVHGHNEYEKDGRKASSADKPWLINYKWDVWIEFYKSFLDTRKDQVDCTAFYEFIYPTYRPAYTPLKDAQVDTLGNSMAQILTRGALNDNYQLQKMAKANLPVNLTITAHSMGGLVSREAIHQFDGWLAKNFQKLVTWGTPHHGSPLITFGYLVHGPYRTLEGGTYLSLLSNLLGKDITTWAVDRFLQLDTPGERDLRWDNIQPLRLDDLFLVAKDSIPSGVNAAQFDLNKGAWLFNSNLTTFNQNDPNRNGEKYHFLYGITSKRYATWRDVLSRETATGASIISGLMQNTDGAMPNLSGKVGDSDGAVPLASMAGLYIADFHSDFVGDIDHEEYFSHDANLLHGDKVAKWTFDRLGLTKPRCACATLELKDIGDLKAIAVDADLEVEAKFTLDPELDPKPGKRIQTAEALFFIAGSKDEFVLGDLDIEEDGQLTGSFSMPDLGEGEHQLVVRAHFPDQTRLESIPKAKELYKSIRVIASPVDTGICYRSNGDTTNFSYYESGKIIWSGTGDFTTELLDNNFNTPITESLSGSLSPDGKSISLQFEYVFHDEYEASSFDKSGRGAFINIPFVDHISEPKYNMEYDRFVIEGPAATLRQYMQFWHLEGYTTDGVPDLEEVTSEDIEYCDEPGGIEIWMMTAGGVE